VRDERSCELLAFPSERSMHGASSACWVTQSTSNQSPHVFSEIWEYFKLRAEILSLLLRRRLEFVTQRQLSNSKSAELAGFFAATA
jgi:hypothetical protein